MKTQLKPQNVIVILLLFVSLFSVLPVVTWADQSSPPGTATIDLSGQAIPFDTGSGVGVPSSAALKLTGSTQKVGDSEFTIQNVTGSLQIGSTSYTVSNGQGDVNQGQGQITIVADTSSPVDDHQLVLNGALQGSTISFPAPSSRLTSQFFLELTGGLTVNGDLGNSIIANASGSNQSSTVLANATVTSNSTVSNAFAAVSANNMTTSTMVNGTATSSMVNNTAAPAMANSTNPPTMANVTSTTLNNATLVAQFGNQSAPSTPPQNVTVTVTQTIANFTVTQAVTVTVANVTITTTVANTTITVNNSTKTSSTP